jgi:hypothetical protein
MSRKIALLKLKKPSVRVCDDFDIVYDKQLVNLVNDNIKSKILIISGFLTFIRFIDQ